MIQILEMFGSADFTTPALIAGPVMLLGAGVLAWSQRGRMQAIEEAVVAGSTED